MFPELQKQAQLVFVSHTRDRIVAERMRWRNKSVQADGGGVMLTSTKLSEAGHGASPSLLSPSARSWVLKGRSNMTVDGDDTIVLTCVGGSCFVPLLFQCIHVYFFLLCPFHLFNFIFFFVNTTRHGEMPFSVPSVCFLFPSPLYFLHVFSSAWFTPALASVIKPTWWSSANQLPAVPCRIGPPACHQVSLRHATLTHILEKIIYSHVKKQNKLRHSSTFNGKNKLFWRFSGKKGLL